MAIVASEPHQKNDFEFFWGRDGGVPGRRRQSRELGGGGRGVEGSGGGSRGVRAEGIGVRAWGERDVEENVFLGPGGRGPWSGATEARDGLDFELGRSRG